MPETPLAPPSPPRLEPALLAHVVPVGIACLLAAEARSSRPDFRRGFAGRVVVAVHLRQFKVYFDDDGSPCAFVSWAWLTSEVRERLAADPGYELHLCEWREGEHAQIIDVVSLPGGFRHVVRDVKHQVMAAEPQFSWLSARTARERVWRRRAA